MRASLDVWVLAALCAAAVGACAVERPAPDLPQRAIPMVGTGHAPAAAVTTVPERASLDRQGGSVALVRQGDRWLAYVADADSHALHTVDLGLARQIASTELPGSPSQLLVLADGRVAVSLQDAATVALLQPGATPDDPLQLAATVQTSAEPVGLALTPDDATLLVTSALDAELVAFDVASLAPRFAVSLPRDPRAIVVDGKGERAFVSHAVGTAMSVVDLGETHGVRAISLAVGKANTKERDDRPRAGGQGYALARAVLPSQEGNGTEAGKPIAGRAPAPPASERIFAPMVTVDPGEAAVPSVAYYGPPIETVSRAAPIVGVVEAASERASARTKIAAARPLRECLLPRAAVVRASNQTLFVACAGINALIELDTRSPDPSRLRRRLFDVPSGPTGVAIDDDNARAVVWSQFEGKVSIIDLREGKRPDMAVVAVDVSYQPRPEIAAIARGREIFYRTGDSRIARDGVGCATCHPDGRDDGLTWATPDGPRQTPMLAGRVNDTAPYGWKGKHGQLKQYLSNTVSRLGGNGLDEFEMMSLVLYLQGAPRPAASRPQVGTRLAERRARQDRGREIFFSAGQRCASCHVAGATDKELHDVGSKVKADDSSRFDTPSLQFVRATAPYFHDGRYATLEELLAKDRTMGHAALLTAADRGAVAAYLESL